MSSSNYRPKRVQNLPQLQVEARRGHPPEFYPESLHLVNAVVLYKNEIGDRIQANFGDPSMLIFPRSAIKLLQAILLVESGAIKKFGLGSEEIALACASHHGAQEHLMVLEAWLKKLGISEEKMVCAAHAPYDSESANKLIRSGLDPRRLHNNCSGKHLGLLSAMLASGQSERQYQDWQHPVQEQMRDLIGQFAEMEIHKMCWGVDGCGIPTYQMPLRSLAEAMEKFAEPQIHRQAIQLIIQAIGAHPLLLGGQKSLCSQVVEATGGGVVIKTGAEGVYAGFCNRTKMAFGLKVVDGAARAAEAASLWILQKYKALKSEEAKKLQARIHPNLLNWGGEHVGDIRVKEVVSPEALN